MTTDSIMMIVMALITTGGAGTIIAAIVNRKKTKSEVTDINVKTAVELERMAMTRYIEASGSLDEAKKELRNAKDELLDAKREVIEAKNELSKAKDELKEARQIYDVYKRHCVVLEDLLREHKIPVPDRPTL
jgi:chromosome segregation ATPase